MTKKVIVAYIPVLHQGYKAFLDANPSYHSMYILGNEILKSDRSVQKDLRRLDPALVRQSLTTWNVLDEIKVAESDTLQLLNSSDISVLMPDEDLSHLISQMYFPKAKTEYYPIFLRWDRTQSNAKDPVSANSEVTNEEFHRAFLQNAEQESIKSADIWRQVGAVLVKDGKELGRSHNHATPSPHSSWMYGDPRNNFTKGADIDKTVFIHAEAYLIGRAAREGVALEESDMYVTTFPCPPCAMLIAESGIKRLFFRDGYASLDGETVLKSNNVEIIRVIDAAVTSKNTISTKVAYPEK